jgi:hypothetical protein
MATAAETAPTAKPMNPEAAAEKANARSRRTRTPEEEDGEGRARYFLGKRDNEDGSPNFEREVASEGEALVEALRLGVTYYAVKEFRVIPDLAGKRPQLKKEPVNGRYEKAAGTRMTDATTPRHTAGEERASVS